MSAIFRENQNLEAEARGGVSVDVVDIGLVLGVVMLTVGLLLVWVPLALIVTGGLIAGVCLWRVVT